MDARFKGSIEENTSFLWVNGTWLLDMPLLRCRILQSQTQIDALCLEYSRKPLYFTDYKGYFLCRDGKPTVTLLPTWSAGSWIYANAKGMLRSPQRNTYFCEEHVIAAMQTRQGYKLFYCPRCPFDLPNGMAKDSTRCGTSLPEGKKHHVFIGTMATTYVPDIMKAIAFSA